MNSKLYVGNLPYTVKQEELEELFANEGKVKSVRLIMDQFSGKAKGFGFIEMETAEDAESAQRGLDGKEFMGRAMKVNPAIEREQRRDSRRF